MVRLTLQDFVKPLHFLVQAGQEMNGVKRNKDKYSREGRQALKAGAGALHPSWSAKRQQNAGIGQAIQGRKTVFNE